MPEQKKPPVKRKLIAGKKQAVGNSAKQQSQLDDLLKKKDPNIALILALVGAVLFGVLPGIGHIYMGMTRKGLVYCAASLIVWGLVFVAYLGISFVTFGIGAICFPVFILPLLFNLAVVYDLYKITKGEKALLPDF